MTMVASGHKKPVSFSKIEASITILGSQDGQPNSLARLYRRHVREVIKKDSQLFADVVRDSTPNKFRDQIIFMSMFNDIELKREGKRADVYQ